MIRDDVTAEPATPRRPKGRRGTGPTTSAGKMVCAGNALRHGLRSDRAVVAAAGETPEEWESFRAGIVASLGATPGVEAALADRAAHLLWRLRRVTAFETHTVSVSADVAAAPPAGAETIEHLLVRERESEEDARDEARRSGEAVSVLVQVSAGDTAGDVTGEVADVVLSLIAEAANLPTPWHPSRDEFDPALWGLDDHPHEFIGLPVEELAAGIARAAAAGSPPAPEVMTLAAAAARDRQAAQLDLAQRRAEFAARIAPEADRQRMARVGYRLLPDVNAIDKLTRYEAHLGRQLQAALNQLARLQAVRAGRQIVPPVALDVTINASEA